MLDSFKTGLWILCVLAASAGLAAGQNPPATEMLTAAQVRSLTPQQAAQGLPVKTQGSGDVLRRGFQFAFCARQYGGHLLFQPEKQHAAVERRGDGRD